MTKIILNLAVAAFVIGSVGRTALRHQRRRLCVVRRHGSRTIFGMVAAALLVGFVGRASADATGGMDMPGMPGMKMSAAPTEIAPTEANAININNFSFTPKELTIAVGTKVTWTNKDDEPHTVVNAGSPPAFKSTALDSGDSFSFTFDKPGTYKYFCSIHPFMTATVVVK
jgi:plastocyanin